MSDENADEGETIIDPMITLRERCARRKDTLELRAKLDECNKRVNSKPGTAESCLEEMVDFVEAVDRCMSKDLFKYLK